MTPEQGCGEKHHEFSGASFGRHFELVEQQGFHFPVTEVNRPYANPARYDDVVQIETELVAVGRASLSFVYRISREADQALLATGSTKHACIGHSGKVARIPKILFGTLESAAR